MSQDITAELDRIVDPDEGEPAFNPQSDSPSGNKPDEGEKPEPSGESPEPGEPDASTPAGKRIAELTQRLKAVEEDPDVLEARAKRLRKQLGQEIEPVRVQAPVPEQRPIGPSAEEQEAAEKALLESLSKKPIKTIVDVAREVAKQVMENRIGAVESSVFVNTLNQYRAARGQYPIFRSIAPIFEELVTKIDRKSAAGMSAEDVWQLLAATEDMALGRGARLTYEKSVSPVAAGAGTREAAPQMGGSGASGSVGSTKPKVKVTKEMILLGRAAGLSDKEILELAQESAEGGTE